MKQIIEILRELKNPDSNLTDVVFKLHALGAQLTGIHQKKGIFDFLIHMGGDEYVEVNMVISNLNPSEPKQEDDSQTLRQTIVDQGTGEEQEG